MAKRFSGTGTVYEYVAHTLGKRPAVFAAGAYHVAAIALYTGIPIVGGILLKSFCAEHFGFDPPWWVAALVVLVFTHRRQPDRRPGVGADAARRSSSCRWCRS